jgi:putative transposase
MFPRLAGPFSGSPYRHGMGRRPREFSEGIYHVGSHGSDLRHLFLEDSDRLTFLERLGLIVARFELALAAYTLMGNHYHALVATPDARLSEAIQQLHGWYSRRHNKTHARSAHLFRAHFFAREIRSDEDLLATCRYLAHNPVAAGLCETPFDWPWSSVAATAGLASPAIPLDTGPIRAALGDRPDWQTRYRTFIAPPLRTHERQQLGYPGRDRWPSAQAPPPLTRPAASGPPHLTTAPD